MKHKDVKQKSKLRVTLKILYQSFLLLGALIGYFTFYHFFLRPTGVYLNGTIPLTRATLIDYSLSELVKNAEVSSENNPSTEPIK